jgi:hypothetical protein
MIPSIERLRKLPVPQVESAASSRNLLNLIGFIPVLTPAETAKCRDDASKKSENGKRMGKSENNCVLYRGNSSFRTLYSAFNFKIMR